MRTLLPGLAAVAALISVPAAAQPAGPAHKPGGSHWATQSAFGAGHDRNGRFGGGRDRFPDEFEVVAVTHTYGGEWALYNNRSWAPDSYNDWWHDRPDRAYPRWLQNNRDCERVWWSGGGWRC